MFFVDFRQRHYPNRLTSGTKRRDNFIMTGIAVIGHYYQGRELMRIDRENYNFDIILVFIHLGQRFKNNIFGGNIDNRQTLDKFAGCFRRF